MITIDEVARFLEPAKLIRLVDSAGAATLSGPAPILQARKGHVSFCGSTATHPEELIRQARASLVILDRTLPFDGPALASAGVAAVIESDNARLDFMRVVDRFFAAPRPRGIAPSAVIAASARVAKDVYIGPLCSLGERVEIGAGTVIHAGVQIYDRVRIGRNVTIHAGTVIGADGFGYERDAQGVLVKFPHLGGVVIEDDVEIGANTCIDRGALGDTRVCKGARIDNLVHVAHNTVVGRHAAVIAHAMIGGSTQIGDFAWVAPSACLRDRITIGAHAVVGLAAVVTKSVPDGVTVMGAPARDQASQRRLLGKLSKLADESD
jgi:UDP-3-O-[3-hydroxymyristoyl] glucosamine N-acyltransferase